MTLHLSKHRAFVAVLAIVGAAPAAANEIVVNTTVQKISATGGCSLEEAIWSANLDSNIAIDSADPDVHFVVTECAPGDGDDVIFLPQGATFNMTSIVPDPYNVTGPTATPIVFSSITIMGNGAHLVRGNPGRDFSGTNFRAFAVDGDVSVDTNPGGPPVVVSGSGDLVLLDLHIKGFTAHGGTGQNGGGGGLGAGGAVFQRFGSLFVDGCTFENNGAGGGNGTLKDSNAGGGGGGLGGDGGFGRHDTAFNNLSGGGGGGGGARGNGGDNGLFVDVGWSAGGGGGGGGGTFAAGERYDTAVNEAGAGGFRCGGRGGGDDGSSIDADGSGASCDGGGGGGGGTGLILGAGDGGDGAYGGGGGGGAFRLELPSTSGPGGHGGFGGGGGAGGDTDDGGDGGFGGGGGCGTDAEGLGGLFAGDADGASGGGGAGLGGAIFSHGGTTVVENSTFVGNYVVRGTSRSAHNGRDEGAAIFTVGGDVTVVHATLFGNESTGEGAGIVAYHPQSDVVIAPTQLRIYNTIITHSAPNVRTCRFYTGVHAEGAGNAIQANFGCPGMVLGDAAADDPLLLPLALNPPGLTPTMELPLESPAVDAANDIHALPTDQRGVARPLNDGFDIGAFEAREPAADLAVTKSRSVSVALPGDPITFTIHAKNNGPDDAAKVVVTDDLPSGLTLVSCTSLFGTCGGSGNARTVSYAGLGDGDDDTITLATTLDFGVGDGAVITNTASIAGESPPDPEPTNNTASVSVTVHNRSDLLLSQGVTKLAQRKLRYTIHVENQGPFQARQLVVNDPVPSVARFVSVTPGPWTCSAPPVGTTGTLSCTLATLDEKATADLTLVVQATGSGSADVTNTARVSVRTFDPNLANNVATLTTRVTGK